MTAHKDRTEHEYFCPRCREEYERSRPGKCEQCGMMLVPAAYCAQCRGYWRLREGELCPEHGTPLEGESAESAAARAEDEDEARASDSEWDGVVVYEGDTVSAAQVHGAMQDAGIEAELDDSGTDVVAAFLRTSEGMSRVLVSRHDEQRALDVAREFDAGAADAGAGEETSET